MHQHRSADETLDQEPLGPVVRPRRRTAGKRRLALPLAAVAGLLVACSVLPPESADAPPSPSSSLSAVATTAPAPSPSAAAPTPEPTPPAGPAASQPTGLVFPAAGIDMAVLPLTPSDADLAAQTLVPPLTTDAYWLTSYGVPGAGSVNTTYIAGHSWDGKDAPFNRLSDETLVGDEFTLDTGTGSMTYVVDSVITHDKDTLKDSDIWNIVPNRVVLISCYTEDPWGKNVVLTAMPKTA
ncbi:Sortase (surface protein transpeptidase) [Arthrobacter agilis]|uniref:class F sortase n=1 Tax=Arthrobacter agilis TaxID=37921 RepID=UPI000F709D94|nr:class F sortase [Arthrobacter agilis]VDR31068.1 Sortase (surface protein transpeptidase) [Arthrobacter agilis]